MDITLKSIDQIWSEETTNYNFDVDGERYTVNDCGGSFDLLDCESEALTISQKLIPVFEALCLEVDKLNN